MKILVLSCNTGAGHNSAAIAVRDMMIKMGHECVSKDALSFASEYFSKGVSESYNSIVMHTPKAFGFGYRMCKKQTYKPGHLKSASYALNMMYSKRLYLEILREGYDAVICTHVFAAQSITHVKHKHGLRVPIYVVATDYSFCPYYDELDMNKYFISHESIKRDYIIRGIPEEKVVASGIPVSDKFLSDISRAKARAELGLYTDNFLCLLMTGSMGFGNICGLINEIIEKVDGNYDIIVVTGNNYKLKREIETKYKHLKNVCPIGYTDKIHLYMRACNLVVTKPGGLSSTEAMVSNVPLILTMPIPGVETENYELLTELGVAIGGQNFMMAAYCFKDILNDSGLGYQVMAKQQDNINRDAAKTICEHVLRDIGVDV